MVDWVGKLVSFYPLINFILFYNILKVRWVRLVHTWNKSIRSQVRISVLASSTAAATAAKNERKMISLQIDSGEEEEEDLNFEI